MKRDEQRLCELAAQHAGVDPASITPYTTIREDLGLDGQDASHFFEDYEQTFGVDAEELWKRWDKYFSTSGVTLRDVVVLLLSWIVADGLMALFTSVEDAWLIFPIDAFILVVWFVARRFIRGDSTGKRNITVGDLYAATESKRLRLKREAR